MPRLTEEIKKESLEKLKFIGIDNLEKIPDSMQDFENLEYLSFKKVNKEHRVYKYVPIEKIQILITGKSRSLELGEKCKEAKAIYYCLMPKKEDTIEEYSKILEMLNLSTIDGIQEIEEQQKKLHKNIPFQVKYKRSYLWEIYYSERNDKYFMLVPNDNPDYNEMFYVLKKQIEGLKNKKKLYDTIFVPISYCNYSEKICTKNEITDIENYLWKFTNSWPNILEVSDKEDNISIHIIGETSVYDRIKSKYKIVLNDKEETSKFYKKMKALFILQTELQNYYRITTKIDKDSTLEFYNNLTKIEYENLYEFIKNEYIILVKNTKAEHENLEIIEEELTNLKIISIDKDMQYLNKQKEISTYLRYRKTFFGKVKYFFGTKKKKAEETKVEESIVRQEKEEKVDIETLDEVNQNEELYTIENLIAAYSIYKKEKNAIVNAKLDIKALKNKIKNMELKIKNAEIYIEEIDKHKKSIFEFWKFANKDENLELEMGNQNYANNKERIAKTFDFESDLEDIGQKIDKIQRVKLSKPELESIFLTTTNVLELINKLEEIDFNIKLEELKKELEQQKSIYDIENFDIFGASLGDSTKTNKIADKKHREIERNEFKILNITINTTSDELKEKIKQNITLLNESMNKIIAPMDISIYIREKEIKSNQYYVGELDAERVLEGLKDKKCNIYKINIKEGMPLIFLTNIIFFDNQNGTLPIGMNICTKVLFNSEKYELKQIDKEKFKTNKYSINDELASDLIVQEINLFEYDLKEIDE